jgi:hypothetical protein
MSEVEHDVDQDEEEDETQFVAVEEVEPEEEDVEGNKAEEEEEDEEPDEKLDSRVAGNIEDEEEKKDRRREEGRTRRARQKDARERTDRELKFLRGRNEALERKFSTLEQEVDERVTGSEVASIDTNISKAKSDLVLARQVIDQAVEQNDGAHLAEALDHRDTIRDNLRDLESAKEYLTSEENRRSGEPEMRLDPRHVAHANSFMVDHDWWDPRGGDDDSKAVLEIDRQLATEGYNPVTKEYWDELKSRTEKRLPHHFDAGSGETDDDDVQGKAGKNGKTQDRRSRGPTFRTGGRERPLKKNEVHISKERREAMEEAGVWEDPKLRNKYLAAYSKYDEEASQEQGR